jgi:probable HAF family extracellular repeat protein
MKRLLCGLMVLALFLGTAVQAKADYIFTTIDVPNSYFTSAHGINDAGQIVGTYGGKGVHGFLYSGGSYTTLDAPGGSTGWTDAFGISASGQVVGAVHSSGGIRAPVSGYLYQAGSYTPINVPGAHSTLAFGISGSGQIVGTYSITNQNGVGPFFGFLLSGGNYTTLGFGSNAELHGINNAGQMVGFSSSDSFFYSDGTYTPLRVPGTQDTLDTAAYGINDAGQIVGWHRGARGIHGFLLSGGSYSRFDVPDSLDTLLYGINDLGQIVGEYDDANGNTHGFLATPTPEPSTLFLLAIGTLGMIGWAWRRHVRTA